MPKTKNREAITYPPNLDVIQRLAGIYVGKAATLQCSACAEEVWTGDLETLGRAMRSREEMQARIVRLFQHTAFEHAGRADVLLVRHTTELVWKDEQRTEPFPIGLGGVRKAGA